MHMVPVLSWFVVFRQVHFTHTTEPFNTLRPRQNGRYFPHDIFECIFLKENVWIPIKISLKFVPKSPINNSQALVQIMPWSRPGDKPLSEPMLVRLPTHICVTRPQWVKVSLLSLRRSYGCPAAHYNDVIMSAMASQITSRAIVYLVVCSGTYQRKHQTYASLAFVWGINRWPVNSPHQGPVTRKMFPFDDVIMICHVYKLSNIAI